MRVSDYTYELPEKLIAQHPPAKRGASRLLVLDPVSGDITHSKYKDLDQYLDTGDLLILNDTRVMKARLLAKNAKGQDRELLLLEDHHNTDFSKRKVLYRGKIHTGEILHVKNTPVTVETVLDGGIAEISATVNLLELADREGTVPLPPYMHREATKEDVVRYQTVFARQPGSVAAPTASLNFTHELEQRLLKKGVRIAYITLHVGLGTFLPIRADDIEEHVMHSEYFEVPEETIRLIQQTHDKHRIVALGTTVARTLEYAAKDILAANQAISGEANIFIYPGYTFQLVTGLITNFHAPKSTVLMLTAAFANWPHLLRAYESAMSEKYAFLSYGDSMLILR
jgi:S-adenosylmethionine:tRNA ribosyltransferase-isomerase